MSELLKKPYEISLWNDEYRYIIAPKGDDEEPILELRYETATLPTDNSLVILNQYIKEVKLANIGSNKMDSPVRAFAPKLVQNVNGSNTLTFQIYYRYYDEEEEEFKLNPFTNLLVNERKVKLKYDNKWYDFLIKQIDENSENKTFTYTCKDLYINELAKTGYEIELDTELENNQGTITELGDKILEGSDWVVNKEGSDLIKQTEKEALFTYQLPFEISATCLDDFGEYKKDEKYTISNGQVIYIFYSSFVNKENPVQFLWRPTVENNYTTDDEGVILDSPNWEFTVSSEFFKQPLSITTNFFGEKLISKPIVRYLTEIDEYCTVYKKDNVEYYGYPETEYASVTEIQNLLSNGANFLTTNGWIGTTYDTQDKLVLGSTIALSYITVEDKFYKTLRVKFSSEDGFVINTGIYDNRAAIKNFIKDEKYYFAIKKGGTGNITGASIKGVPFDSTYGATETEFFSFEKYPENIQKLEDYEIFVGTCKTSISAKILLTYDLGFYLYGNGEIEIIDGKLFKELRGADGQLIVPDLEDAINSIIRTKYYIFPRTLIDNVIPQQIFDKEDLTFSDICYEEELPEKGYIPQYQENFEKIRSISGSKSNRFNLIQELCETFECWARFEIEHTARGEQIYSYREVKESKFIAGKTYYKLIGEQNNLDINYQIEKEPITGNTYYEKNYHKFVSFKEYIGEDNYTGFRYGINLKSIQRRLISDQITTKLIVEPNNNEFAENGSCTIQTSILNPTGETSLYNFKYYIQQGLLDKEGLYNDLYDTSNGLGLYTHLKSWNTANQEPIIELSKIVNTLNRLNSQKLIYETLTNEAEGQYEEAITGIMAAKKCSREAAETLSRNANENDYIIALVIQRDEAKSVKNNYNSILTNTKKLVNDYNARYALLIANLSDITEKKNALLKEFYKKYSRFIQEGTWVSEDYYDAEEYYLDAQMVLYTSSAPQVTYTINVIEISQVEGFEPYKFKIGDKTYIEDTEFFGWVPETGRPYQEEIIVSEVVMNLDDPSQNTIKVQNYKTQFEDLFQRITATTQSLQYHEGSYNRAAEAVQPNGIIKSSLLEKSMNDNSLIIKNAQNQSVVWDETGITISNHVKPNEIVKLASGGIVLTTNGGKTWTTGITGDGINASTITTGQLNTHNIKIFNETHETFEWNDTGINAYMVGADGVPNYSNFVRFDQFGLYGYVGDRDRVFNNINDVLDYSDFSLTWKGLYLNAGAFDYVLLEEQPADWSSNWKNYFKKVENDYIRISDSVAPVWETGIYYDYRKNGDYVKISTTGETDSFGKKILWAGDSDGDNFVVYSDGSIRANKGYFEGEVKATSGEFTGIVKAEDFLDSEGNSMLENGKIKSNYLDLGNITLDGATGNISMSGNINFSGAGSITWGNNTPVKYQFSVDGKGNWHDTMTEDDLFRRDSLDGGVTWSKEYQFRGVNGRPGSDADVTYENIKLALEDATEAGLKFTSVSGQRIDTPVLYSAEIYGGRIYAGTSYEDSFAEMTGDGFSVYVYDIETPKVFLGQMSEDGEETIRLLLGAGSDTRYPTRDRLHMIKELESASIYYEGFDEAQAGFRFNNNGTISVIGTLEGIDAGDVVARFG